MTAVTKAVCVGYLTDSINDKYLQQGLPWQTQHRTKQL